MIILLKTDICCISFSSCM